MFEEETGGVLEGFINIKTVLAVLEEAPEEVLEEVLEEAPEEVQEEVLEEVLEEVQEIIVTDLVVKIMTPLKSMVKL